MASTGDYLIERLYKEGLTHMFDVPGDYILGFCKKVSNSKKIELVGCTDENQAGFAADAFARVHGIGCVCVTYNVGALKVANAVAGAYAERSPLILISGSPGMAERSEGALLHHMVRSFECQKEIFQNITCCSIVLDDPTTNGYKIDKALKALEYHKQPIYIELPRDIVDKAMTYDVYKQGTPVSPKSDTLNLEEAIAETVEWIGKAKNPVILAGVQTARFGLGDELIKFAQKTNIPIATTLLAKSVVNETHPLFLGIYAGGTSQEGVQAIVEGSDCLLMFGVLLTDMALGFMPSRFEKRQIVNASVEELQISGHTWKNVNFKDFATTLFKSNIPRHTSYIQVKKNKEIKEFVPVPETKIVSARLFEKINSILTEEMAIVADIGDSLFGGMDLVVHEAHQFLSPAFYTSMGFAIPGSLGVALAKPHIRPIVLVGDGAFQMSSSELSTIASRKLNPIVVVLNNHGYTTERFLMDGPFNDIRNWEYHKIVELIGDGLGFEVKTEEDLEKAMTAALKSKVFSVINVHLDPRDVSPALVRMTKGLSKKI